MPFNDNFFIIVFTFSSILQKKTLKIVLFIIVITPINQLGQILSSLLLQSSRMKKLDNFFVITFIALSLLLET